MRKGARICADAQEGQHRDPRKAERFRFDDCFFQPPARLGVLRRRGVISVEQQVDINKNHRQGSSLMASTVAGVVAVKEVLTRF